MRFGVLVWNRNLYTYRMNFIQTSCFWHVVGERHRKPRSHKLIFPPFTLRVLTRVQKVSPELSDCRSKPLKNDGGVTFVETGVTGLPVWKQKEIPSGHGWPGGMRCKWRLNLVFSSSVVDSLKMDASLKVADEVAASAGAACHSTSAAAEIIEHHFLAVMSPS